MRDFYNDLKKAAVLAEHNWDAHALDVFTEMTSKTIGRKAELLGPAARTR